MRSYSPPAKPTLRTFEIRAIPRTWFALLVLNRRLRKAARRDGRPAARSC